MAIIQCPQKHFYDNKKFDECPHCKKAASGQATYNENLTIAKFTSNSNGVGGSLSSLASSVSGTGETESKTIGVYFKNRNINPIAGWLVCIEGENRGRSFEVHIGKNFVGRSMKMDIRTNDESISRENHFTVIYEPESSKFYLIPGNGMTYYNGKLLSEAAELKEDDTIGAGKSKYAFVPFCKEGRDWND